MEYPIRIHHEAQIELDAAISYYNDQKHGLGHDFINLYVLLFYRINKNPFQFPLINSGIRKASLKRFPYSFMFIVDVDYVLIVAVHHQRQQSKNWLSRLKDSF